MRALPSEIRIVADAEALGQIAAEELVRQMAEALRSKESFSLALSGGSTPKYLYSLLASNPSFRTQVPWDKIHFFWGDERHVPPDHPDSNYRMAHEAMLSKSPVPPAHIHRLQTESPDADTVAVEYEQELRACFRLEPGHLPRFDCVLLGMGPDGHTASLFPGTAAVRERTRLVVANWVDKFQTYRITLTAPVLNNADSVIFLVSGEEKAEALQEVLQGEEQPDRFPAQLIRPTRGKLRWLVDQAAARQLDSRA